MPWVNAWCAVLCSRDIWHQAKISLVSTDAEVMTTKLSLPQPFSVAEVLLECSKQEIPLQETPSQHAAAAMRLDHGDVGASLPCSRGKELGPLRFRGILGEPKFRAEFPVVSGGIWLEFRRKRDSYEPCPRCYGQVHPSPDAAYSGG